jgi:hypothetical protein
MEFYFLFGAFVIVFVVLFALALFRGNEFELHGPTYGQPKPIGHSAHGTLWEYASDSST